AHLSRLPAFVVAEMPRRPTIILYTRSRRIDPQIARAKLPMLQLSTPELPHNMRPIKPPTSAPAIPSTAVMKKPPGSLPGINSFAIAPAINPKIIHPIIAPIILLLLWSQISHHLRESGVHQD